MAAPGVPSLGLAGGFLLPVTVADPVICPRRTEALPSADLPLGSRGERAAQRAARPHLAEAKHQDSDLRTLHPRGPEITMRRSLLSLTQVQHPAGQKAPFLAVSPYLTTRVSRKPL
jgi:hypothetical protein